MSSNLNLPSADPMGPASLDAATGACRGRPGKSGKNGLQSAARRYLLLALAGAPLAALPAFASSDPTAGLQRWGSGEFRRFGFLVYGATLWAGDDPQRPPLVLRLDYKRSIAGAAIAEASIKEMRAFTSDEAALKRWGEQMVRVFPDVKPGDHILGVYRPEGATFQHNGRITGEIADPEFARRFFAIWLDPRTSAPELRAALLKRPEA
jgi:Chalcone isomerase-like